MNVQLPSHLRGTSRDFGASRKQKVKMQNAKCETQNGSPSFLLLHFAFCILRFALPVLHYPIARQSLFRLSLGGGHALRWSPSASCQSHASYLPTGGRYVARLTRAG
jgi:hypothetical protein